LAKPRLKKIPEGLIPEYKHEQTIRIISGPEAHYFEIAGLRSFLSTSTRSPPRATAWATASGEPIRHKEGMTNIISAGISLGTVQVPGDGQPIILMADRQTSGGYARIANVITADLTLLAQMRPGDKLNLPLYQPLQNLLLLLPGREILLYQLHSRRRFLFCHHTISLMYEIVSFCHSEKPSEESMHNTSAPASTSSRHPFPVIPCIDTRPNN
jgi:hypothetical protein